MESFGRAGEVGLFVFITSCLSDKDQTDVRGWQFLKVEIFLFFRNSAIIIPG